MGRHIVVMGASAGGVDALQAVVAGLPAELPAPVVVVLHVAAARPVRGRASCRAPSTR